MLFTQQGAVNKVIIAQDSLRKFINDIRPGAYVSLTRVNFKDLDNLSVKPLGIYGSKESIVSFLGTLGVVDDSKSAFKSLKLWYHLTLPTGPEISLLLMHEMTR